VPVLLGGRSRPSDSLGCCIDDAILGGCCTPDAPVGTAPVIRCGGKGYSGSTPLVDIFRAAGGGLEMDDLSPALALTSKLIPKSLGRVSSAGFFGMGGAGFRAMLEVVDFVDT